MATLLYVSQHCPTGVPTHERPQTRKIRGARPPSLHPIRVGWDGPTYLYAIKNRATQLSLARPLARWRRNPRAPGRGVRPHCSPGSMFSL